jgi:cation diffusion facilitator family transporter
LTKAIRWVKNAKLAMLLTLAMMVLEITAGYYFNSMALLADGWHMSSHTLALGLSVSAYAAARKLANDRRFSFGTWKIEILAGYTSAICLLLVAALMALNPYNACSRLPPFTISRP